MLADKVDASVQYGVYLYEIIHAAWRVMARIGASWRVMARYGALWHVMARYGVFSSLWRVGVCLVFSRNGHTIN